MPYTLVFLEDARAFFVDPKIDRRVKRMIRKKISLLIQYPELGKPLLGELFGYRRLVVSYYRVIYKIVKHQLIIEVVQVGLRRDIYD